MDFEWQTQAPTDPKSPFPQSKPGQKGFESLPPFPSLSNKPSTSDAKFRAPSFTTPRKSIEPEFYSETSGIESSPGEPGDHDDTPEQTKSFQTQTAFMSSGTFRQPIFGRYGTDFLGTSPGRAEQRQGKLGKTIIQKMRKRKRISRDHSLDRITDSESDDRNPKPRSRGNKNSKLKSEALELGILASFFSYLESHPNLPNILSFYAQLFVNLFIAGLTIFGMYTFWTTVRADVDKASEHERSLALSEIAKCAHDFVINGCGSKNRPPVMEIPCNEFDLCMNRDPNSVGRARISAHTFAQIFNSFIEPISYKAMIFIILIITVTLLVNNLAFGLYRTKSHQHAPFPQNSFPQQSNPFANPGAQGVPQWITQTPTHNSGYDVYSGQTFQNIGLSHVPDGARITRRSSREHSSKERGLSRSPSKRDRDLGNSNNKELVPF
ncbi:hypothetical protein K3495_g2670 [Podosphaera aphanis]|nr:hypothetical protein K3495_g2670 [Podosphaera aphanis]